MSGRLKAICADSKRLRTRSKLISTTSFNSVGATGALTCSVEKSTSPWTILLMRWQVSIRVAVIFLIFSEVPGRAISEKFDGCSLALRYKLADIEVLDFDDVIRSLG